MAERSTVPPVFSIHALPFSSTNSCRLYKMLLICRSFDLLLVYGECSFPIIFFHILVGLGK